MFTYVEGGNSVFILLNKSNFEDVHFCNTRKFSRDDATVLVEQLQQFR
jgi:hypothetical protein